MYRVSLYTSNNELAIQYHRQLQLVFDVVFDCFRGCSRSAQILSYENYRMCSKTRTIIL
jgi:hypothetical protein